METETGGGRLKRRGVGEVEGVEKVEVIGEGRCCQVEKKGAVMILREGERNNKTCEGKVDLTEKKEKKKAKKRS